MSGIERLGGGGGELGRGGGGKGGGEGPGGIRKGPLEKVNLLPEDWAPETIEGGWNFPAKNPPKQDLVILTTFEVENTFETIVSSPGAGEEAGKCDEEEKEGAMKEKKAEKEQETEGAAPRSAPTGPAPSPKPVVPPVPEASSTPQAASPPPPLPSPPLPVPSRGPSAPTTTTTRATSSRKFQVDAEDVIAVFQGCCAAYALYLLGNGRVGEDAAVKLVLGLIGGTAAVEWAKAFRSRGKKRVRVVEE